MQITGQCVPWKIINCAENFVYQMLQFQKMAVCHEFSYRAGTDQYRPNQCFVEG